ncbi:glutathione S-transferase family protein [Thalassotalea ponticola]|uniref:glutathione S-transferase family protein n=1 Tax=Thalassotalea ponticola TaxID=1523392 RepID=UPI0025B28AC2|nr:glutathione S-transferase family protein [Thalassotalea ponticola]MDN3652076.1 glutathione S-transferase family protein [Thalassotalea ponticola]
MKLYGSTASPFVRRIRIYAYSIDLEFIALDIFSDGDRQTLIQHNPCLKVPFLLDDQQSILDSRVIFRYLQEKFSLTALSWQQENLLTLIDAANDSFVSLLLLQRSGVDVDNDIMFCKLQHQRIEQVLSYLSNLVEQGDFSDWHYPSICLYCLLDWVVFRQLLDLDAYPTLKRFLNEHCNREEVLATAPF